MPVVDIPAAAPIALLGFACSHNVKKVSLRKNACNYIFIIMRPCFISRNSLLIEHVGRREWNNHFVDKKLLGVRVSRRQFHRASLT